MSLQIPVTFTFPLSALAPTVFDGVRAGSRVSGDAQDAHLVERTVTYDEEGVEFGVERRVVGTLLSWRFHRGAGMVWCTALIEPSVRTRRWAIAKIDLNALDSRHDAPLPLPSGDHLHGAYIRSLDLIEIDEGKEDARGPEMTWLTGAQAWDEATA